MQLWLAFIKASLRYALIYMHALYAACARDEKKVFFAKIIELDRSFQKLLEFCKSNENWAQLQALKLRRMLKLFATQQILMFLMFSLARKLKKINKLVRTSRTSKFAA